MLCDSSSYECIGISFTGFFRLSMNFDTIVLYDTCIAMYIATKVVKDE